MAQTVRQVFISKSLWAWFDSPVTNYYDGVNEKGHDYSTTFGTPVGAAVGGQVVRLEHNNNAINDVVEIMAGDGSVWLYQHITAKCRVGDTLGCGSVVGTENGLPIDQYSTGPHIEVRYCPPGAWKPTIDSWSEPWTNPRQRFAEVGSEIAGAVSAGGVLGLLRQFVGGTTGNIGGGKPAITLAPNADVSDLLLAFDTVMELRNPFDNINAQQDSFNVAGQSVNFTDPVSWLDGLGSNVVDDLVAAGARLFFFILGMAIIIKVVSHFIDVGALFQAGQQAIKTVGVLAA